MVTFFRRSRLFTVLLMATVLCVVGCDSQSRREAGEAFGEAIGEVILEAGKQEARKRIDREVTPVIVASILGEFAPGGHAAVLNGLLADAWWDEQLRAIASESEFGPEIIPRSPLTSIIPRK